MGVPLELLDVEEELLEDALDEDDATAELEDDAAAPPAPPTDDEDEDEDDVEPPIPWPPKPELEELELDELVIPTQPLELAELEDVVAWRLPVVPAAQLRATRALATAQGARRLETRRWARIRRK